MKPLVLPAVLAVPLLAVPLLGVPQPLAPDALARALQKHYQGVRDFSASFVHTYRGGVLRTQAKEEGTVTVKKPGMMRFTYTAPEKKEFVSDGVKVYSYIPQDKQVIVTPVPSQDEATTPALFLAGKGDMTRYFTPSAMASPVPGAVALKLTPRREEPDYEYLVVAVDPATLKWRALSTKDRQGGESTLIFSNLKENQGLSDKDFVFRIPRGVQVFTDGIQSSNNGTRK